MFPFNYTLDAKAGPEYDYGSVLELAEEEGLGTLCIKGFAKGPWPEDLPEDERPYDTWYEPYDTREDIVECLRYALSQGMTSIPNAGDPDLVPLILEAARDYESMSYDEAGRTTRVRPRSGTRPCPGTEEDDRGCSGRRLDMNAINRFSRPARIRVFQRGSDSGIPFVDRCVDRRCFDVRRIDGQFVVEAFWEDERHVIPAYKRLDDLIPTVRRLAHRDEQFGISDDGWRSRVVADDVPVDILDIRDRCA